ncbi:hypothetical protein HPB48_003481 [Haemaphysalis longicornis]|uniref:Uncharacterized protein n=1 Tax=Haemaphysalis longicornis TaxID=44386 RepID=A0A9J6GFF9_HAELO|nr:hypothetical protein HPB48_003481 [Haemaphysalis longicornis]
MPKAVPAGFRTQEAEGDQGWLRMTATGARSLGRGFSLGLPRHRLFARASTKGEEAKPKHQSRGGCLDAFCKAYPAGKGTLETVGRDRRMMNGGRRGGRSLRAGTGRNLSFTRNPSPIFFVPLFLLPRVPRSWLEFFPSIRPMKTRLENEQKPAVHTK